MSFVSVPVLVLAVTESLEAFFIVLIKLNSSSPSINQAKFPCEKNKNSFTLYAAGLIIGLVLLNLIARDIFKRFDLTDNSMYSLSSSSRKIVENLDDLLTMKVYFSDNLPNELGNTRRFLQDILEEYSAWSDDVRFFFHNPESDTDLEEQARKDGIQPVQMQVIENDKVEIKKVYLGMVLLYENKKEVIPVIQTTAGLEYMISTKIKSLIDIDKKTMDMVNERLPIILQDEEKIEGSPGNYTGADTVGIPYDYMLNSYFTLVTESHNREVDTFITTEKLTKPLLGMHPFILLGQPYTLKHLKDKGFETFSEVIDESYDNEVDDTIRFSKIVNECNNLFKNNTQKDLHNLYYDVLYDKLEHNYYNYIKVIEKEFQIIKDIIDDKI